MQSQPLLQSSPSRIGIIGGGIAGSTIALKLAQQGLDVTLLEQGPSLVNGPPICHLHAGGNLYREIDDNQCITLLKQSVETLKLYQDSADYRPTVIAIPQRDPGDIEQLLPRLELLQHEYQQLVAQDSANKVLGEPSDYFSLYSKEQIQRIAKLEPVARPRTQEQWLIPVAKSLDLTQLKFPLVLVQEYGLSVFRLAATATLSLSDFENAKVFTNTQVQKITESDDTTNAKWLVDCITDSVSQQRQFDYLINACGYQSGRIDDLIGHHSDRLVEFKAAYVTQWPENDTMWPEVIFYGQRGTPNGMAQLTPYPGGYFQVHGMTQDITLFDQGLVKNSAQSAQPQLPSPFIKKLNSQWPAELIEQRTQRAIDFVSQFIPPFDSAQVGGKPLFGAQQIPGQDPDLRAADVSFIHPYYARCEIVKASSAIDAANALIEQLTNIGLHQPNLKLATNNLMLSDNISSEAIEALAITLASERGYPTQLAQRLTTNN